jgi:hypothetical protein
MRDTEDDEHDEHAAGSSWQETVEGYLNAHIRSSSQSTPPQKSQIAGSPASSTQWDEINCAFLPPECLTAAPGGTLIANDDGYLHCQLNEDGLNKQTHCFVPDLHLSRTSFKSPSAPGPCGEAATKVAPHCETSILDDVGSEQGNHTECISRKNESNTERNPSLGQRIYTFCFPPTRPYEELCENIQIASLNLFPTDMYFRRICIIAVKSKAFERLSLGLILTNCIFLAMDSKSPDFESTRLGAVLNMAEQFFIVAFTLEMIAKILALGLYGAKGSYLRDPWNVIDFVIVVMGWVSISPRVENINSMRTVRVLRPLRTITGVEGMRMLVTTLLSSLPMLLDVLILVAFLFLIFGAIAVQTFAGALRRQCGVPIPGGFEGSDMVNITNFEPRYYLHGLDVCGRDIIRLKPEGIRIAANGKL